MVNIKLIYIRLVVIIQLFFMLVYKFLFQSTGCFTKITVCRTDNFFMLIYSWVYIVEYNTIHAVIYNLLKWEWGNEGIIYKISRMFVMLIIILICLFLGMPYKILMICYKIVYLLLSGQANTYTLFKCYLNNYIQDSCYRSDQLIFLSKNNKIFTNGNFIKIIFLKAIAPQLEWIYCGGTWHRCYNINGYSFVLTTKAKTLGHNNIVTDQITPRGEFIFANVNKFDKLELKTGFSQPGSVQTNALFLKILSEWRGGGCSLFIQNNGIASTVFKKIVYEEFIKDANSKYLEEINNYIVSSDL